MTRRFTALLFRSPENTHHVTELSTRFPDVAWIDVAMPNDLEGYGEAADEQLKLHRALKKLSDRHLVDLIVYSRAYGAFSEESRKALAQVFGVHVVTATGAVLAALHRHEARRLAVLTPYESDRHEFELDWLRKNDFEIAEAIGLGHPIDGGIARLTASDLPLTGLERARADAIYVACTMLPVSVLDAASREADQLLVSATHALADEVERYLTMLGGDSEGPRFGGRG